MLKVGKYKAWIKTILNCKKVVLDIKSKYKSLRKASRYTPYSWTQFHRLIKVKYAASRKSEYTRKLSMQTIADIQKSFE